MAPCSADAKQHWVGRGKGGRGNAYGVARQTVGPYRAGPVARRYPTVPGRDLSKSESVSYPCKTLQDILQDALQDVIFTEDFPARRSLNGKRVGELKYFPCFVNVLQGNPR